MKKFIIPKSVVQVSAPVVNHAGIRQAKSKAALMESGGRRVSINLAMEAVADLEAIKVRDRVDNTGAIIEALRRLARL